MKNSIKIKEQFLADRDEVFREHDKHKDAFKFCVRYSLLVEEYVYRILAGRKFNFVIASLGSFSRRELAPFSDIDMMIITKSVEENEAEIKSAVTELWDCGIEVSHTVREFEDIKHFLKEDLHAFTQFFETRYLLGRKDIYGEWNQLLFEQITDKDKFNLINEFFQDTKERYSKYGASPKVLEPNIKFSAGCLRDIHLIEWMYALKNDMLLSEQSESTQTEKFLTHLKMNKVVNSKEITRILEAYKVILNARIYLHKFNDRDNDRLEFSYQEKIANALEIGWHDYMKEFFKSTSNINRFSRTMRKRFEEQISKPISEYLTINLDEDFTLKGKVISINSDKLLSLPEMMRSFYYRGLHDGRFDENLRSLIIESVNEYEETQAEELSSSVFFREILKLPRNVGKTLQTMNELGLLGAFLTQFKDLVGFFQPGVYHCYTADEHTLIALRNIEHVAEKDEHLGVIYENLVKKDLLYLAVLFHDIAKPISVAGHEIIGCEIAANIMEKLGYALNEINLVKFLVRHHLTMEQVAFRRNLNDGSTLDNFSSLFNSLLSLDMLYILTYGDLSAVSPVIWTKWKSDLLYELYSKTYEMLKTRISGEELLYSDTLQIMNGINEMTDDSTKDHVESINDVGYLSFYSQREINKHAEEIAKGSKITVFFNNDGQFTTVTVITKDFDSLLSRLCGALAINDVNILDARIFTRNDGIVIDSFNVSDFRTHKQIDKTRFDKIRNDLTIAIDDDPYISREFEKMKSRWWRIENKFFKRKGKTNIEFEDHDNFTIIDVFSPDRLGLLYRITQKMNEMGISIYFAKIATHSDDVVDAFYILDRNGKKVSKNDYDMIKHELLSTINDLL